jgi:N4-gp56 family major capsid protein
MAYAPVVAQNTSGSNILGQLTQYALQRKALEILRTKFHFLKVCMPDTLEKREGKVRSWYRYTNLPAATSASPEGIVGTSLAMPPAKVVTAIAAQYADFGTLSDVLRDTAVDPILENLVDALSFRAGLTTDNVTRAVLDNESGASSAALSTYLSIRDFRANMMILQGKNVPPHESDGLYQCFSHPYTLFDVMNDPSSAGLTDLRKYTDGDAGVHGKMEDRGLFIVTENCRITSNTNVLQTVGTPNKWRTYIVGRQAIGAVTLAGYDPSKITDPNKEDFRVRSKVLTDVDVANPTGQIGAFASYNFMHVAKVLEGGAGIGGTYRYAYIDTPSSIVS